MIQPENGWVSFLAGFLWSCAVAALGLVALAIFRPGWGDYDNYALCTFLAALGGIPLIIRGACLLPPKDWPGVLRIISAGVLGGAAVAASLYAGLLLFGFGSLRMGYIG